MSCREAGHHRHLRSSLLALGLIALAALPVRAQDDGELRRVFEQILQDPGNPGLNLRYAPLAIDRGELRKALAAYERILAQDPDNEEAKAGIRRIQRQLEPTLTRATLLLSRRGDGNQGGQSARTAASRDLDYVRKMFYSPRASS